MNYEKEGHKKRLRQRFKKDGLGGFHDYEVLELILSYSLVRSDTKNLAKKLIKSFGSLTDVINTPVESLISFKGIGERTAVLIKLFKDVGSFHLHEEILTGDSISSPEDVYDYIEFYYRGKDKEEFMVFHLNASHRIISAEPLFKGTIDRSAVYVRELIKEVLKLNSLALILVHNHPSGELKPSIQDRQITQKIKRALNYIDVKLLDHIICSNKGFYSFRKNNLI